MGRLILQYRLLMKEVTILHHSLKPRGRSHCSRLQNVANCVLLSIRDLSGENANQTKNRETYCCEGIESLIRLSRRRNIASVFCSTQRPPGKSAATAGCTVVPLGNLLADRCQAAPGPPCGHQHLRLGTMLGQGSSTQHASAEMERCAACYTGKVQLCVLVWV